MAIEVMTWVFANSRSKNAERLVMLAVADACNSPDGTGAWLSNAALRAKTLLSERAVQEAVIRCERLGELKVDRGCGRGGVNRFAVVMTAKAPLPGDKGNPAESAPLTETPQNLPPAESALIRMGDTSQASPRNPADSAPKVTDGKGAESAPGTKNSSTKSSSTKNVASTRKSEPYREDVERICTHLADKIEANGSMRPTITVEWRREARLLLDTARPIPVTLDRVINAIDWCQANEFWHTNILSMKKLRKQWEPLRLARMAELNRQKRQQERGHEREASKPASNAPRAIPAAERCTKHPSYRAEGCGACRADSLAMNPGR